MTTVSTNTDSLPRYITDANGNPSGISQSSAVTSVNSNSASQTLLTANGLRRGATIVNTDANTLFIRLSTGAATAANPTAILATNGYYEVPFGYTGAISGIWSAAGAGVASITQFT